MTGFLCILVLQKHKVTNQASLPSLPAGPHMAMPLPWPAAPGMGAGPLHSPLCCIPPPPAWAERAFLKGASSAAPDSHSRAQSAQQPGVDRGAGFGWVSTGPPAVQPVSLQASPLPPLRSGCPSLPILPLPPPLRSSLGRVRMVRSTAGLEDPPSLLLPWEGTDWPELMMTQ